MIAQSTKPDSVVSDVQLVLANNEYISINNKKIDIQYDQKGISTSTTKNSNRKTMQIYKKSKMLRYSIKSTN